MVTIQNGDPQDKSVAMAIENAIAAYVARKKGKPDVYCKIEIDITPTKVSYMTNVRDGGAIAII